MTLLNYLYLVLALVLVAVGAKQCSYWSEWSGTIQPMHLLSFLPAVVFLAVYAAGRKATRKVTHALLVLLCVVTVGGWWLGTVIVDTLMTATGEVTNVKRYGEILKCRWAEHGTLVQHFPRTIPSDAKDARFSFVPAFLQGGAHIQLRYSTTPAMIAELYEQFAGRKTKSFTGGDTNDHMNMTEGMPTTFFYTSGSRNPKFPHDYEIMIFDRILKEKDRPPGFYWNHGQSHGVAISKKRNEIVYWADSW